MFPSFRFAGPAFVLAALSLSVLPAHAQKKLPVKPSAKTTLIGIYRGKLVITPTASLTLVFRFGGTAGKPTATLDVPEQGAKGVPVAQTVLKGNAVTLRLPDIGATFEGTRGKDGKSIFGTFSQGGKSLPLTLTLTQSETSPLLLRPQTPKPPFPYRVEEVSYTNPKAAGVTLAGTLNTPEGTGPFPVALFITGSGSQDRDETIMGHKPFAVLGDHLARRGIASLRVDDRGVGKSTGATAAVTSADFASDVRAGVEYLKARTEIDAKQIGLIGHSEGGFIAPMVAADTPDVAFIVLLAGTGVDGKKIILEQQKAAIEAMGFPEAAVRENLRFSEAVLAIIEAEKDPAVARQKVTALIKKAVAAAPEAQRPAATRQLQSAYLPWCEPWFFYFLRTDPASVLQSVTCPVLALNGSLDIQVSAKQNLSSIEAALKKGNNKDVTVRELPGLNHLFQHAKTGHPLEYEKISETFSPEALALISDWIAARATKAAAP